MSHNQQSSYQQPWPALSSEPPRAAGMLSPQDAEKSTRWRLVLGCSALFLALFSGFYAYMNIASLFRATNAVSAAGGYVPQSALTAAVAIIAVFCVLVIAYAGIGAWNIVARGSTAKSPLIAAIILAAVAVVLIFVYMANTSTGGFQVGGLGLNALIVSRAAIVLRMKKIPAYPAASD
jgi:magnesium-transporting ATPase (P-type)